MRGVFRTGDRLTLEPCLLKEAERGDLLVFTRDDQEIVHRVVQTDLWSLVTWGDSNPTADVQPVTAGMIRGRVVACHRAGRDVPVRNGKRGLRRFRLHQLRWKLVFLINRLLNRHLSPGSFSWLHRIDPQLLRLADPLDWKIIHNQRSIGRYNPQSGAFQIRKPWFFFVSKTFIRTRLTVRHPESDKT